ncbi:hypothetical protein E4U23_001904 [Claviceps purpurea]|nr:hypothetical protein E4U23_001904 [Claviceps purpurea]
MSAAGDLRIFKPGFGARGLSIGMHDSGEPLCRSLSLHFNTYPDSDHRTFSASSGPKISTASAGDYSALADIPRNDLPQRCESDGEAQRRVRRNMLRHQLCIKQRQIDRRLHPGRKGLGSSRHLRVVQLRPGTVKMCRKK